MAGQGGMMSVSRADLRTGAYLTSPDGLFRVQGVRAGTGGVSEVVLTDEREPLVTQRLPDPDEPGLPARYRVVEPEPLVLPTHRVMATFALVRYGPDPADTASVEEWGSGST